MDKKKKQTAVVDHHTCPICVGEAGQKVFPSRQSFSMHLVHMHHLDGAAIREIWAAKQQAPTPARTQEVLAPAPPTPQVSKRQRTTGAILFQTETETHPTGPSLQDGIEYLELKTEIMRECVTDLRRFLKQ
jgi:hypothetical protein